MDSKKSKKEGASLTEGAQDPVAVAVRANDASSASSFGFGASAEGTSKKKKMKGKKNKKMMDEEDVSVTIEMMTNPAEAVISVNKKQRKLSNCGGGVAVPLPMALLGVASVIAIVYGVSTGGCSAKLCTQLFPESASDDTNGKQSSPNPHPILIILT